MVQYFPDLGLALALSAGMGIGGECSGPSTGPAANPPDRYPERGTAWHESTRLSSRSWDFWPRRPLGYDIKKEVEERLSHFWSESYGHIYPMLRRLHDRDLW
jgi:hypothetical protein